MPPGKTERGEASIPSHALKKPRYESRYSEMDPVRKAELRKHEREFKKDRERTMRYFMSVKRAIDDVEGNQAQMDEARVQEAIHSIVDGFLTEFQKKLKTDIALFRNSALCRVIEAVVSRSDLIQMKSFLTMLFGYYADLIHSPTASFIFETALASLYYNLSLNDSKDTEVSTDLPTSLSILNNIIEEITECLDSALVDLPASRSLSSLILMLSGEPIRGVPRPAKPARFPELLQHFSETVITAIEQNFSQDNHESHTWLAAASHIAASKVLQALLITDNGGSLAKRFDHMYIKGRHILEHMINESSSCNVLQAYLRTTRDAWTRVFSMIEGQTGLFPPNGILLQVHYVLQDLILFSRDQDSLRLLWEKVIHPNLPAILASAEYAVLMTKFTRKCAFAGVQEQVEGSSYFEEANVKTDIQNGSEYFSVDIDFKGTVCIAINNCKELGSKGLAHALLIDQVAGPHHGCAIVYNILKFGAKPSAYLFNSFDKLRANDLVLLCDTSVGSCVMQCYIATAASRDSGLKTSQSMLRLIRRLAPHLCDMAAKKFAGYVVEAAYDHSCVEGKEIVAKSLTSLLSSLQSEDQQTMTDHAEGNIGFGAVVSTDGLSKSIAKKVIAHCCVDQYIHRRADWLSNAEKQSNVKRMMMQIIG